MARITVDDCLHRIPNRFQLTLAATYRARQLGAGVLPQAEAGLGEVLGSPGRARVLSRSRSGAGRGEAPALSWRAR